MVRHCATNCPWDRFMIARVAASDTGTLSSATRASSGLIQIIIASTASTVSSDWSSWLIVCCRVWLMLSMSLVTRLSSSPRGERSK